MQVRISINANTSDVNIVTQQAVQKVFREVMDRGTRAAIALRNAETNVLSGQRGGRVYKKPNTGVRYTASAPGEPPAARNGTLRESFGIKVEYGGGDGGVTVRPMTQSALKYAHYLEHGTRKMAPRPFKNRVREKAMPEVVRIYSEPYL